MKKGGKNVLYDKGKNIVVNYFPKIMQSTNWECIRMFVVGRQAGWLQMTYKIIVHLVFVKMFVFFVKSGLFIHLHSINFMENTFS